MTEGADAQMQSVWRDGQRIVTWCLEKQEASQSNIHIVVGAEKDILVCLVSSYFWMSETDRVVDTGHQSGESAAGMGNEGICGEWLMNPIVLS